jgi:hypothetical protein
MSKEFITKRKVAKIIFNKIQEKKEEFEYYSRDNDSFYFENQSAYHAMDEVLRELLQELLAEMNEDDIE